jgi:hypothetical protein
MRVLLALILMAVYAVAVTPAAIVLRLLGRRPFDAAAADTYWQPADADSADRASYHQAT